MLKISSIKRYYRQLLAFIEKNILLSLRIKSDFFLRMLNPFISLLLLFFIYNLLFRQGLTIGYWNHDNYALFLLISISLQFTLSIRSRYNTLFIREKYWKTLSATMVAPVNRFTLLAGVIVSELVINSIPLIALFVITLILYPISILFIFFFLLVYFLIYLTFASIGLFMSAFSISNEKIVPYIRLIMRFVMLFSCVSYPKEILPSEFSYFVLINPFYYFFDLLRLMWYIGIDFDLAVSYITPVHLILIILLPILFTIIALYVFDSVYKKYGITGY